MGSAPPDPSLLAVFRTEVAESVGVMHDSFLRIERDVPERPDLLEDVLRLAHDLKGSAHVVGYDMLGKLAHSLETRLIRWRSAPLVSSGEIDLAFRSSDTLKDLSGDVRDEALVSRANALILELEAESEARTGNGPRPERPAVEAAPVQATPLQARERRNPVAEDRRRPAGETLRVARAHVECMSDEVAVLLADSLGAKARLDELDRSIATLQAVRLPRDGASGRDVARARNEVDAATSSIRAACGTLGETLRQLDQHARDLDGRSRALCLVPVNPLLVHLERVARETAAALGRKVDVIVEGRDLLLSPTLVEALKGPLTHAVRNAVDHGIEPAARRLSAAKPEHGTLRIALNEVGDTLHCEVSDDGSGIDIDAVRRRLGARAEGLDDAQMLHALLRSGVSTRDAVTEISGRGLGLGSLAVTADRLRGHVSIDSTPGQGCTLLLEVPLQLSLLDGLVVEAGGSSFVLPLAGLEGVERGEGKGAPLASIVGLSCLGRPAHIVTLKGRDRNVVIAVDEVRSRSEFVRRPLNAHLGRVPFVEGVTTLPRGEPVLILDTREIADACGGAIEHDSDHATEASAAASRILLVDDSATLRAKLSLDLGREGFDVVLAADGQAALEKLDAMPFAALVTDVQMPGMDGMQLLSLCAGRLPVILITAFPEEAGRARALELGASAYIAKSDQVDVDVIDALNACLVYSPEILS